MKHTKEQQTTNKTFEEEVARMMDNTRAQEVTLCFSREEHLRCFQRLCADETKETRADRNTVVLDGQALKIWLNKVVNIRSSSLNFQTSSTLEVKPYEAGFLFVFVDCGCSILFQHANMETEGIVPSMSTVEATLMLDENLAGLVGEQWDSLDGLEAIPSPVYHFLLEVSCRRTTLTWLQGALVERALTQVLSADEKDFVNEGVIRELERRLLNHYTVPNNRPLVSRKRGVLLYGPPGTGKSMVSTWLAQKLGFRTVFAGNSSAFSNKYIGETEERLRDLWQEASKFPNTPSLIVLEEIDSIGAKRKGDSQEHTVSWVNTILSQFDFHTNNNVLVVGTTNRREHLDEALLRPGRIELQIYVGRPSAEERRTILSRAFSDVQGVSAHFQDTYRWQQFELDKHMANFTGAAVKQLAGLVKDDLLEMERSQSPPLTPDEFFHLITERTEQVLRTSLDPDLLMYRPISNRLPEADIAEVLSRGGFSGLVLLDLNSGRITFERENGAIDSIPCRHPPLRSTPIRQVAAELSFVLGVANTFVVDSERTDYLKDDSLQCNSFQSLRDAAHHAASQQKSLVVFDADDLCGVITDFQNQSGITGSSNVQKSQTVQSYRTESKRLLREQVFRRMVTHVNKLKFVEEATPGGQAQACFAVCVARDEFLVSRLKKAFMWELDTKYFETNYRPPNVHVSETFAATDDGHSKPFGRVVSRRLISPDESMLVTFRIFLGTTAGKVSVGLGPKGISLEGDDGIVGEKRENGFGFQIHSDRIETFFQPGASLTMPQVAADSYSNNTFGLLVEGGGDHFLRVHLLHWTNFKWHHRGRLPDNLVPRTELAFVAGLSGAKTSVELLDAHLVDPRPLVPPLAIHALDQSSRLQGLSMAMISQTHVKQAVNQWNTRFGRPLEHGHVYYVEFSILNMTSPGHVMFGLAPDSNDAGLDRCVVHHLGQDNQGGCALYIHNGVVYFGDNRGSQNLAASMQGPFAGKKVGMLVDLRAGSPLFSTVTFFFVDSNGEYQNKGSLLVGLGARTRPAVSLHTVGDEVSWIGYDEAERFPDDVQTFAGCAMDRNGFEADLASSYQGVAMFSVSPTRVKQAVNQWNTRFGRPLEHGHVYYVEFSILNMTSPGHVMFGLAPDSNDAGLDRCVAHHLGQDNQGGCALYLHNGVVHFGDNRGSQNLAASMQGPFAGKKVGMLIDLRAGSPLFSTVTFFFVDSNGEYQNKGSLLVGVGARTRPAVSLHTVGDEVSWIGYDEAERFPDDVQTFAGCAMDRNGFEADLASSYQGVAMFSVSPTRVKQAVNQWNTRFGRPLEHGHVYYVEFSILNMTSPGYVMFGLAPDSNDAGLDRCVAHHLGQDNQGGCALYLHNGVVYFGDNRGSQNLAASMQGPFAGKKVGMLVDLRAGSPLFSTVTFFFVDSNGEYQNKGSLIKDTGVRTRPAVSLHTVGDEVSWIGLDQVERFPSDVRAFAELR